MSEGELGLCCLVDDAYVIGLSVFLRSLNRIHPALEAPLVVLHDGLSEGGRDSIRRAHRNVKFRRVAAELYHRCDFGGNRHWNLNPAYRFEIFRLEEFEQLLYFDADLLVVREVSRLLAFRGAFGACRLPAGEGMELASSSGFNAGVMSVNRSLRSMTTWDLLMACAHSQRWSGNQVILNRVLGEQVAYLEAEYNMSTDQLTTESLSTARIIHFVGQTKPWEPSGVGDHQRRKAGAAVCEAAVALWHAAAR